MDIILIHRNHTFSHPNKRTQDHKQQLSAAATEVVQRKAREESLKTQLEAAKASVAKVEANFKAQLKAAEASAAKVEANLKAQLEAAEARAERAEVRVGKAEARADKAEARADKLVNSVGSDLKVNYYGDEVSRNHVQ